MPWNCIWKNCHLTLIQTRIAEHSASVSNLASSNSWWDSSPNVLEQATDLTHTSLIWGGISSVWTMSSKWWKIIFRYSDNSKIWQSTWLPQYMGGGEMAWVEKKEEELFASVVTRREPERMVLGNAEITPDLVEWLVADPQVDVGSSHHVKHKRRCKIFYFNDVNSIY